jgi:outer membrane porin, OprD family
MIRGLLASVPLGIGCLLSLPAARGEGAVSSPASFIHVEGTLRYYNFSKEYESPTHQNERSGAVGGLLRLSTTPFLGGFGLGLGLYGAWSTHSFPPGDREQEPTLVGAAPVLTAVGEAYGQYAHDGLLIRGGRQIMNTPWMGPRDSRMMPQTFNGLWGQYEPLTGLQLVLARVYTFKSRDSSGFSYDNLYYPSPYLGDELQGTTKIFPMRTLPAKAPGALAAAVRYERQGAHVELWYYDFYDFAQTEYLDGGYTFGAPDAGWHPYIDAQYMRQSGGDYLTRYDATLFGMGGKANVTLWGLRGGVKFGATNLSVSYDNLEHHSGSFGGGAIVSPYGNRTALYASAMTAYLFKYGPGGSLKLAGTHWFLHHSMKLQLAALEFHTSYSGHSDTLYFDGSYSFRGALQGLRIRDRLAWDNGAELNDGHAFMYNRLMLQYKFSL